MPQKKQLALAGLFAVSLAALTSGCATSELAQSDWEWQQANPNWKPPIPPDGRPKWGVFSAPDY